MPKKIDPKRANSYEECRQTLISLLQERYIESSSWLSLAMVEIASGNLFHDKASTEYLETMRERCKRIVDIYCDEQLAKQKMTCDISLASEQERKRNAN